MFVRRVIPFDDIFKRSNRCLRAASVFVCVYNYGENEEATIKIINNISPVQCVASVLLGFSNTLHAILFGVYAYGCCLPH